MSSWEKSPVALDFCFKTKGWFPVSPSFHFCTSLSYFNSLWSELLFFSGFQFWQLSRELLYGSRCGHVDPAGHSWFCWCSPTSSSAPELFLMEMDNTACPPPRLVLCYAQTEDSMTPGDWGPPTLVFTNYIWDLLAILMATRNQVSLEYSPLHLFLYIHSLSPHTRTTVLMPFP